MLAELFLLGLVCWVVTTIIVESELFQPLRDWVGMRSRWFGYLFRCHLCVGVWIGLLLAAMFGSPWGGFFGWIAGGLCIKAIAHLVLELRPQAWVPLIGDR